MHAFQLSNQSSARSEVHFRWLFVVEMYFFPFDFSKQHFVLSRLSSDYTLVGSFI